MFTLRSGGPLLLVMLLTGCSKEPVQAPVPHGHVAPHGGVLVPLGDHVANLELVWDLKARRLTAYVLDGHAEQSVRVAEPHLELELSGDSVLLMPVTSALSGERIGDTSAFAAEIGDRGTAPVAGNLRRLEARGQLFEGIPFSLKPVESPPSEETGQ